MWAWLFSCEGSFRAAGQDPAGQGGGWGGWAKEGDEWKVLLSLGKGAQSHRKEKVLAKAPLLSRLPAARCPLACLSSRKWAEPRDHYIGVQPMVTCRAWGEAQQGDGGTHAGW